MDATTNTGSNGGKTNGVAERMFRVSLGGEERIAPQSKAMDVAEELHKKYGGAPSVVPVDAAEAPVAPASGVLPTEPVPPPVPESIAPVTARTSEGAVDATAKARIDEQQRVLREGGITGVGYRGEGGDGDQFYRNGTVMMGMGYDTQRQRKAEHEAAMPIEQAALALSAVVKNEQRRDEQCTARDFANALSVNGKISVFGKTLSEQAIRGLLGRIESPALSYVLGVRNRIIAEMAKPEIASDDNPDVELRNINAARADRAKIADVIRHECMRNPDQTLKLRMRDNPGDVFAVVSPGFAPADAPEVVGQILGNMPKGAKGTWSYHPSSTQWELRLQVWTPTPVDQQAVGEAFAGFVSFRARDNGTSKFRGGGGIEILRCLNASIYVADGKTVDRVHRGQIMYDIPAMMEGGLQAISVLCKAWGVNREIEVPLPTVNDKVISIEEAIPGFYRYLLTDRRELVGVLPGRTEKHVDGLTKAFASERRVTDRLVRSDFGQGLTKYLQTLPIPTQRDCEAQVGDWLMAPRPMRCELRDSK